MFAHADAGSDSIVTDKHQAYYIVLNKLQQEATSLISQVVPDTCGEIFFDPSQHFFSQARYISVRSFVILMHYLYIYILSTSTGGQSKLL